MNISKFLKIFTVGLFLLSLGDSGHFYAAEAKKAGNKGIIFSSAPPGFQARDARYATPPGKFPPTDFRPPDPQRPNFPPDEFMPPWDVPAEPQGQPIAQSHTPVDPNDVVLLMLDAEKKKGILVDPQTALAEGNIDNAVISEFFFRKEDGSVLDEAPIAVSFNSNKNDFHVGTDSRTIRGYNLFGSSAFLNSNGKYFEGKTAAVPELLYNHIYSLNDDLSASGNTMRTITFTDTGMEEWPEEPAPFVTYGLSSCDDNQGGSIAVPVNPKGGWPVLPTGFVSHDFLMASIFYDSIEKKYYADIYNPLQNYLPDASSAYLGTSVENYGFNDSWYDLYDKENQRIYRDVYDHDLGYLEKFILDGELVNCADPGDPPRYFLNWQGYLLPANYWDAWYEYRRDGEFTVGSSAIEEIVEFPYSILGNPKEGDVGGVAGKQPVMVPLVGPFSFASVIAYTDYSYWYNTPGNLYGEIPLFSSPNAPLFPDFYLTYNSFIPWSMMLNPIGRGWSHSFNIRLLPGVYDTWNVPTELRWGDGEVCDYTRKNENDEFLSPVMDFSSSTPNSSDNGSRLYKGIYEGETLGYRLIRRDGKIYRFDNGGRLKFIEDLYGNKITLTYDKQKLIKIEDNYGRKIELEYTQDDMLKTVIGPQQTFDIEHANPTYITKITNRQTQESYQFGYTDNLVRNYSTDELINSYTGPDGVNYQIEYEDPENWFVYWWGLWWNLEHGEGWLSQVKKGTNANQKTYEMAWSQEWPVDTVDIKDWNGNLTKHEYDLNTDEFTVTDPLGYKTATKFGDFDQVEYFKDKNGNATNYTYTERPDTHALLLDEIDYPSVGGEAISESFTYYDDPGGFHWLNTHTDPEGNKTTYNRDLATGFVTSMVDGENKEWKYTPHGTAKGKVASVEDPNHHITTYDYDVWGYLNKVDPPGPTPATTFVNNIMGLPTKKTDAKGNSTDYFYDGAMRVTDVYVDK